MERLTIHRHVDQAILSEEERLVVIRFGRDWDADCMRQDEVLYSISLLSPHLFTLVLKMPRNRRPRQELCRSLCVRSRSSPRLQTDVRAIRFSDPHVLLPQQAHGKLLLSSKISAIANLRIDVRFWDRK